MLNQNFLTCAKAEIKDLTVCIVVNGEQFQSHAVTLNLIRHCPILNSSELFPYATIRSSFKRIEPLCFELTSTKAHRQKDTQTDRHTHTETDTHTQTDTHTHTDRHEYSIVVVVNCKYNPDS